MKDFTDERFLARFNRGDEKAFVQAYDFFMPKIYRFLYYKARQDKTLTDDMAQRTFMKAWEYVTCQNRDVENIQAFLYRIARNLMIDHWRVQHKETYELKDFLIETADDPKMIEAIDARIEVEQLMSHMDTIPEQYKEVITLRFIQELDIDEIATIMEKDKNNIYVLIHRALKTLRAKILE